MPIELIREEERFTLEIFGAEIYYRRLPADVAARIRKQCERRGVVDDTMVARGVVEYCVLGWNDKVFLDGVPATFSQELARKLPSDVVIEIVERITQASGAGGTAEVDPTRTSASTSGQ